MAPRTSDSTAPPAVYNVSLPRVSPLTCSGIGSAPSVHQVLRAQKCGVRRLVDVRVHGSFPGFPCRTLIPGGAVLTPEQVAYTAYSFDAIWGILDGGTGRHLNQLTPEQIYIGLKAWYISEILYAPVSAMVRTSVALFLMRVSVSPRFRWIIIVNLAIVWTMSIIFMFVVTFQCDPPSYFYGQALGLEGHCLPITVVPNITIAHSVIGGLCDLIFASLPVPMLWNVQINKRTKIIIALLLGMGAVGGVALMVRIPFIRVLAISSDFLYETM